MTTVRLVAAAMVAIEGSGTAPSEPFGERPTTSMPRPRPARDLLAFVPTAFRGRCNDLDSTFDDQTYAQAVVTHSRELAQLHDGGRRTRSTTGSSTIRRVPTRSSRRSSRSPTTRTRRRSCRTARRRRRTTPRRGRRSGAAGECSASRPAKESAAGRYSRRRVDRREARDRGPGVQRRRSRTRAPLLRERLRAAHQAEPLRDTRRRRPRPRSGARARPCSRSCPRRRPAGAGSWTNSAGSARESLYRWRLWMVANVEACHARRRARGGRVRPLRQHRCDGHVLRQLRRSPVVANTQELHGITCPGSDTYDAPGRRKVAT